MNCPRCGHSNRVDARFCQVCGQSLSPVSPRQPACMNCQKPMRSGVKFCPHCGARQLGGASPDYLPPQLPPAPWPQPVPASPPDPAQVSGTRPRSGKPTRGYVLRHGALIAVLILGLAAALTAALVTGGYSSATILPPPVVSPPAVPAPTPMPTADYRESVVEIGYDRTGRFGLKTRRGDPATVSDDNKLLTFDFAGATSNTRVWIDGDTPIYGGSTFLGFGLSNLAEGPNETNGRVTSAWEKDGIRVEQTLSYVQGSTTQRVDTMQIKYVISNNSSRSHQVGLRIMLDTLIGDNDGVPFVVPGREGITSRAIDLRGGDIPDFIQALERPNLADPGVIVNLTLRGGDATSPDRLVISAWCDENAEWDYYRGLGGDGHPLDRCGQAGQTPDSAVAIYFDPQSLAPGEQRTIITYYGLGGISSTESGNTGLSLTFNRSVQQDDTFWVTALVLQPQAGQRVQLTLPPGLGFAPGNAAEQPVLGGDDFTQVSWLVEAKEPLRDGLLTATLLPDGLTETQSINVSAKGLVR
ncbi:MAG: zinc ribbon domain-containing protein [Anaerolineae bacterium]|nr:zinc ribbon domain-containing protein [Anaerolineae bacterium]